MPVKMVSAVFQTHKAPDTETKENDMTIDRFLTSSTFRSMFDALPFPVFMIDDGVLVHYCNTAAVALLFRHEPSLNGEIHHVWNDGLSTEGAEDRWRAILRRDAFLVMSVERAIDERRMVRRAAQLDIFPEGLRTRPATMITCSPFDIGARRHALLIFENMCSRNERKGLIHVCSVCQKVIDEQETLARIESYAKEYGGVEFSHGLCPKCLKSEMAKIEAFQVEEPRPCRPKVMTAWSQV
jgi:hypothetical protein